MNTTECIHSRRSIRHFADKPVPHEVLEEVIADAAYAPSWKNTQVTRYYVCDDAKIKEHIARDCTMGFTYNAGTLERAPQVAVLTAVKGRSGMEKDGSSTTQRGGSWLMFDVGAAAQTFCLAAYAYGVGTVIMGVFDPEMVAQALHIPENEEVVALIPFGYPDETPAAPKRKSVEQLLTFCE